MIVFCTTCKGRAQHIKQTLIKNIQDNRLESKFILLDYGSQDDLIPYIKENCRDYISSEKLVVYSFNTSEPFHVSHAKNMAARLGIIEGADILVTLDADNFTGPNFDKYIYDKFKEPGIFMCPNHAGIRKIPHGPNRPNRGFAGRLAVRTKEFIKAGGYDETYDTWRGEDIDFNARMERMGYTMRFIDNCYLNAIPHNAQVRFNEYPHARQYEAPGSWRINGKETTTIVNYGRFGLGKVYKNFNPVSIELTPIPTRVFGIGLHKTATTSLHKAFQILEFDSFHWGTGEAPLIWDEMNSAGRSKTLEKKYSLCDLPIPLLYEKLDKGYPGSKFILTVRDEEKWLKSVERLWDPQYNRTRWEWDVYPFSNRIHTALYGQKDFNAEIFLNRYRKHNAEVKEYFKNRPEDLLVMDMDTGAGWGELCSFLGMKIPSQLYPREYITRYFGTIDLNPTVIGNDCAEIAIIAISEVTHTSEIEDNEETKKIVDSIVEKLDNIINSVNENLYVATKLSQARLILDFFLKYWLTILAWLVVVIVIIYCLK